MKITEAGLDCAAEPSGTIQIIFRMTREGKAQRRQKSKKFVQSGAKMYYFT